MKDNFGIDFDDHTSGIHWWVDIVTLPDKCNSINIVVNSVQVSKRNNYIMQHGLQIRWYSKININ